jgi:hypothetical protein
MTTLELVKPEQTLEARVRDLERAIALLLRDEPPEPPPPVVRRSIVLAFDPEWLYLAALAGLIVLGLAVGNRTLAVIGTLALVGELYGPVI